MATNPRAQAARILTQVLVHGRSLARALPADLGRVRAAPDRSLVQEICFGVLRWEPRLSALLALLLDRPLRGRDAEVRSLLLVGLYQLVYLRMPAHAAVDETVRAARALGRSWATRLVNGVLRAFLRDRARLTMQVDRLPPAALAHPAWLLEVLRTAWPEQWRGIVDADNTHPPMHLRVNARRGTRAEYLARREQAGLAARPLPHTAHGLALEQPVDVARLPGFDDGLVSVQDGAAQLAAPLLAVRAGQRVLDACAAPGGKTAHIAELTPQLARLVSVDRDARRLARVDENLRRLGLSALTIVGDASKPESWWDGEPFDRILLDAPCSATGVIRRHPDIKVLRRAQDVDAFAMRQANLLEALWPLLTRGGMLLYATCSILPRENVQVVEDFLHRHRGARPLTMDVPWGHACRTGRQVLPGEDGMDGFYFACLERR